MTATPQQIAQLQRFYRELGEHRVRPAIFNAAGRPTALRNLTALQAARAIETLAAADRA